MAAPALRLLDHLRRCACRVFLRPVTLTWTGDTTLRVTVSGEVDLTWELELGAAAGPVLRAGRLGLTGSVPNRQGFRAKPRRMWFVFRSSATLDGEDLGSLQPLHVQTKLGDFWIPQRGIFLIGASSFEVFDPARHLPSTVRGTA